MTTADLSKMSEEEQWAYAKKLASESSGLFVSLKNDGDKAVGVFVGKMQIKFLSWDKKAEKYEDYTAEHEAKGLPKTPRFLFNFWLRSEKQCRIIEMNGATFEDVIAVREKYNLTDYAYEVCRHGAKGDTKTTYTILPEKALLSAEEKALIAAATLHDLTKQIGGDAASDMDSHDKTKGKANGSTNGAKAAAPAGAAAPAPGADVIDVDTRNKLVARLKAFPRAVVDTFLAFMGVQKMGMMKKSDVPKAEAELDRLEGKSATPPAEENDPFS